MSHNATNRTSSDQKLNIPLINISSIVEPEQYSPEEIKATIDQIGQACAEWGFFYVVGHQIDPIFRKKVEKICLQFFEKPKEFKKTIARTATNFRGYNETEFTKQIIDWKEIFDYGAELVNPDMRDPTFDRENQWPAEDDLPDFKALMLEYFDEMHRLAEILMTAVFKSLGLNSDRFQKDFEGSRYTSLVRVNYYPICPKPDAHLGVNSHTDPCALTILWQDDDVNSLQVEKDGVFYDVYPVPDSYVVNIADMVQVWSNGLYKAPVHRVLANHDNVRFSLPFFFGPSYHCDVEPLEACITEFTPKRYRTINYGNFMKARMDGNYADIGEEIQAHHFLIDTE